MGWRLTRRSPGSVQVVTFEHQRARRSALRRINEHTRLREGIQRTPQVAVLVNTNAVSQPWHLAKVIGWWRSSGDDLLAVDPDVDRLNISASQKTVLGRACLGHTVDFRDNPVFACVATENVRSVFEFVLLVAATAETHGCDDAVCDFAGARVSVHCVEGDGGSWVGCESDKLDSLVSAGIIHV